MYVYVNSLLLLLFELEINECRRKKKNFYFHNLLIYFVICCIAFE